MIDTVEFFETLKTEGLDFFTGVPDSLLKDICACITENCDADHNIIAANEGNAVGMAAGYHMSTGKFGIVYMQNSGLGNTVNPLLSLADKAVYSIPMLLLIGWRGEPGTKDEPQHVTQGRLTLPILETLEIDYKILDDNYHNQLRECMNYMKNENKPIALVVPKGTFSEYKSQKKEDSHNLKREDALEIIIDDLNEDDIIVSTTGKTSREIFEIRERKNQGHANDFLTVGSMGHTASIAFGMSLGSEKNIYCIDGDGALLMHMGGLSVSVLNAGDNFKYIINNNGAHESVGGQPTVGRAIDIKGILYASGFEYVDEANSEDEIKNGMQTLKNNGKAALIINTKQGSRSDLGRPTTTPVENKNALMDKLKEEN